MKRSSVSKATKARTDFASIHQDPARKPWVLLVLGAIAFVGVLAIKLGSGSFAPDQSEDASKVYSAAASTFEPMAVNSRQTGLIEPPGVAKPLRLFGVKPGANATEGIAILGPAEASSRTYVSGALLENGARLAELYVDHVVLLRGGQRYTLYLPKAGASDQLQSVGAQGLTVGDFPAAEPPLDARTARVSDALRIAPAYDGDQVTGYSVYAGSRASQLEQWGLKPGDVLVSLAGAPLTSSEQVEGLLDQLTQGAALVGEVRRGPDRITVTLDGSKLVAAAPPVPPAMPPFP